MQIRCPHCHHPIEVVDEKLLDELTCPSCGSNITLVSKDTVAADAETRLGSTVHFQQRRLGHFELLEQVGVGGYGAVWKARDTVLDRIVAVKIPRRGQLSSSEAEYFLRDARAAAQLRHPNIVSVHEVGRDGETLFIASEFIDGANLYEWLQARKLTVQESAELVATIAEAVQQAHERGVVHRDLKPGNILMDLYGRPHVTDFGLAKRETGEVTMTVDGQILGTPAYMSPEQARGKAHEADAKSDVYSLGVILFELLTGELPFRGEKRMLIVQILNDEPPSPRKLNGRVPRDLETICLKCLEKEPRKRYVTAAELAADLRCFVRGEAIAARPVGQAERVWRWWRRHPVAAALQGTITVSLILATIGVAILAIQTNKLRTTSQLLQQSRSAAEQASRRLELELHASNIALTEASIDRNDAVQAEAYLESSPARNRGWEWQRLRSQLNRCQTTERVHDGLVMAVAYDPKGRYFVSVSAHGTNHSHEDLPDNKLMIWSPDGKLLHRLKGHPKGRGILNVAVASDGARIATAGADGKVRIWDPLNGELAGELDSDQRTPLWGIAFDPFGNSVYAGDEYGQLYAWDVSTRALRQTIAAHDGPLWGVAFQPNGTLLATCGRDGRIMLWSPPEATPRKVLAGHTAEVDGIVFSSDGRYLYSASDDTTVRKWDVVEGNSLMEMKGHSDWVRGIAISPDDNTLASAGRDKTVRLWDTTTGELLSTLLGHTDYVRSVCIDPIRSWLVSGGDDGVVRTWTNPTDSLQAEILLSDAGNSLHSYAFFHDSERLLVWTNQRLLTFDADTGELIDAAPPDGQFHGVYEVENLRLSPDDRLVFIQSEKGLACWEHATRTSKYVLESVQAFDISHDGRKLAVARIDQVGGIEIRDALSSALERSLKGGATSFASVRFFADSYALAALGRDQQCHIWGADGRHRSFPLTGHAGNVTRFAISSDGSSIASASEADPIIRIWNTESGALRQVLKGHSAPVRDLTFCHDDMRLISAGDETLRLWDPRIGKSLMTLWSRRGALTYGGEVLQVGVDRTGTRLAALASTEPTSLRIWHSTPTSAKRTRFRRVPMQQPRVWRPAEEISGADADGQPLNLSDFQGQVVVLDFFADWCPNCREMYPLERRLVEKFQGRPFALLGVNLDSEEALRRLIDNGAVTWRCWTDGRAIASEWQIDSVPDIYLIDHTGIVRRHVIGKPRDEAFTAEIELLVREAESEGARQ